MRKNIVYSLIGFIAGLIVMGFISSELNPLSNQLVNSVLWYQHSDEMKAIYLQNFNIAKQIVEMESIKNQNQRRLAVIVDIDETMLDNSPFEGRLIHTGKSFNHDLWDQWVKRSEAKALPGAAEFTQFAKRHGVDVFYISNRNVTNTQATLENLRKQGFAFADSAHLLLKDKTSDKTQRRQQVRSLYKVILYLGDNMGDFDQIYKMGSKEYDSTALWRDSNLWGTRYIVMPNPMYGTWEHTLFPRGKKLTALDRALIKINHIKGF